MPAAAAPPVFPSYIPLPVVLPESVSPCFSLSQRGSLRVINIGALILARNAVYDKRDESPHPSCHIAASTTVRASVYADEQVDSASTCPGTGAPARQHSAVPAAQSSSAAVSCDPG